MAKEITFENKTDEIVFSDTNKEITFEDKTPVLVFDVFIPETGGFTYIFPYILS